MQRKEFPSLSTASQFGSSFVLYFLEKMSAAAFILLQQDSGACFTVHLDFLVDVSELYEY